MRWYHRAPGRTYIHVYCRECRQGSQSVGAMTGYNEGPLDPWVLEPGVSQSDVQIDADRPTVCLSVALCPSASVSLCLRVCTCVFTYVRSSIVHSVSQCRSHVCPSVCVHISRSQFAADVRLLFPLLTTDWISLSRSVSVLDPSPLDVTGHVLRLTRDFIWTIYSCACCGRIYCVHCPLWPGWSVSNEY